MDWRVVLLHVILGIKFLKNPLQDRLAGCSVAHLFLWAKWQLALATWMWSFPVWANQTYLSAGHSSTGQVRLWRPDPFISSKTTSPRLSSPSSSFCSSPQSLERLLSPRGKEKGEWGGVTGMSWCQNSSHWAGLHTVPQSHCTNLTSAWEGEKNTTQWVLRKGAIGGAEQMTWS